jgi:hypothetical protein
MGNVGLLLTSLYFKWLPTFISASLLPQELIIVPSHLVF